jgi:hypothetical protein
LAVGRRDQSQKCPYLSWCLLPLWSEARRDSSLEYFGGDLDIEKSIIEDIDGQIVAHRIYGTYEEALLSIVVIEGGAPDDLAVCESKLYSQTAEMRCINNLFELLPFAVERVPFKTSYEKHRLKIIDSDPSRLSLISMLR